MTYTVGEMARRMGMAPSALRYYDKEGLLPFLERSASGGRIFREEDFAWLRLIECLKASGMSIREIRSYIDLFVQGDQTIPQRLDLFLRRREVVLQQMEALRQTLDAVNFKCWYYETAQAEGSTERLQNLRPEDVPEAFREAFQRLNQPPEKP